ncbi:hypothetical protein LCGC14_1915540, partial [marine sediment metagenome]
MLACLRCTCNLRTVHAKHIAYITFATFAITNNPPEDGTSTEWKHGRGDDCFSTKELMQLSQQQVLIGMIANTKNLYKAEVNA